MTITIKHRFTGAVIFTSDAAKTTGEAAVEAVKAGVVLRGAYLRGADLRDADLGDADLRGAYLRSADLRDAYLRGADLRDADLGDADLRGAYLRDADLGDADLRGAHLRDADLGDAKGIDDKALAARIAEPRPTVPKIEHIHQRLLAAVTAEGCRLDMATWHSCETAHCRAGWVVTIAGEQGLALEKRFGPANAARMIYRESDQDFRTANFFAQNEEAMADIVACAEREAAKERLVIAGTEGEGL